MNVTKNDWGMHSMSYNKTGIDPARSLNLLWGPQNVPGRSGLTIKKIIDMGIEIADSDGLDEVSMRKIADRLGVGTMSLYTYVPGKNELLELMLDSAVADLYNQKNLPIEQGKDWKHSLQYIAERNWELYQKHPWILDISGGRPVLGPHTTLKYELELRALEEIGLTDVEMDATLSLALMHVESCARLAAKILAAQRNTGMDELEWWIAHAPSLERLVDDSKFPLASRVGEAAGQANQGAQNPQHAYAFGLERIIAGTVALINKQS